MSSKLALEKCSILVAIFFAAAVIKVNSYRILGFSMSPQKSHFIFFNALMDGLAEDGNEVTFLTPFQPYNSVSNLRHIQFEVPIDFKDIPVQSALEKNGLNCFALTNVAYNLSNAYVDGTIRSKQFQEFLHENKRFDVVLVEAFVGGALLSLGRYLNAPVIAVFPSTANKWTRDLVGAPNLASFPHAFTEHSDNMNFWQRMYNSLCFLYDDVMNPWLYASVQQRFLDSMYPNGKKMPPLDELKRNVSLVLYNSHPVLEYPAPAHSNMIPIAGLFIKKEKPVPLSSEIGTFLNESKGAIYVSFGSNADFSEFHQSKKDAVINAFNEFPGIRIIFKSNEQIVIPSHSPANVMVRPWFPQQAILAHDRVKLFITQGGTLSFTEAIHFAKPIIGIPIRSDQTRSMNMAQRKGYGLSVPYEEVTAAKLRMAIRKVLTDPSYADNMKLASNRFRKQIKPPLDTAIYWVKYVAKHKGAPRLRCIGIDMPFYVFYNLDCWAFLIVCCAIVALAFIKICHVLWSRFLKSITKKHKLP